LIHRPVATRCRHCGGTNKGTRGLAQELRRRGHSVSPRTVAGLLQRDLGYNLQVTPEDPAKEPTTPQTGTRSSSTSTGASGSINAVVSRSSRSTPRRRNLSGISPMRGREWQPKGKPEKVRTHDFQDKELGKVAPLRRLRHGKEPGMGSALEQITTLRRSPWRPFVSGGARWARRCTPKARQVLVTADCGGSNGIPPAPGASRLSAFCVEP